MSNYSPIFKLALGAVWTAGYRPDHQQKSALQSACGYSIDYEALYRDRGQGQAIEALRKAGYPIADDPSGYDLLQPLPRDPFVWIPQPSHGVRCLTNWVSSTCERVHLQGRLGELRRGYTIANAAGGWHIGTSPDRPNFASMGCGGPASILYLDTRHLKPTGETVRLRGWDFAYSPEAHAGVDYLITVPLWEWQPDDSHFIGWEAAEGPAWDGHVTCASIQSEI